MLFVSVKLFENPEKCKTKNCWKKLGIRRVKVHLLCIFEIWIQKNSNYVVANKSLLDLSFK